MGSPSPVIEHPDLGIRDDRINTTPEKVIAVVEVLEDRRGLQIAADLEKVSVFVLGEERGPHEYSARVGMPAAFA